MSIVREWQQVWRKRNLLFGCIGYFHWGVLVLWVWGVRVGSARVYYGTSSTTVQHGAHCFLVDKDGRLPNQLHTWAFTIQG